MILRVALSLPHTVYAWLFNWPLMTSTHNWKPGPPLRWLQANAQQLRVAGGAVLAADVELFHLYRVFWKT